MKKEYLKPNVDVIAFTAKEALMDGTGIGGIGGSSEGVEEDWGEE